MVRILWSRLIPKLYSVPDLYSTYTLFLTTKISKMSVNHLLILLLGLPTTYVYESFFYFYDDAAGINYTLLIVML